MDALYYVLIYFLIAIPMSILIGCVIRRKIDGENYE